jgi:hypothetical protein
MDNGYEVVRVILDDDYEHPYHFIVKTLEKHDVIKKLFEFSYNWTKDNDETDYYLHNRFGGFDDYLFYSIKEHKLDVREYMMQTFIEGWY